MIEKTIVKLLMKISKQLEDISEAQDKVRSEIFMLQSELSTYQEYTISLEQKLNKNGIISTSLN